MSRPIDSHGVTDRGRVRETNEDQFLVAHRRTAIEGDKPVVSTGTGFPGGVIVVEIKE